MVNLFYVELEREFELNEILEFELELKNT